MKIVDLSEFPMEDAPQPEPEPPKEGFHDGDDDEDDEPPFDFILDDSSGIKIAPNGKAHYFARGIEVSREDYLACVATSHIMSADLGGFIDGLERLLLMLKGEVR